MPTPSLHTRRGHILPLCAPLSFVSKQRVQAHVSAQSTGLAVDTYDRCWHDCEYGLTGRGGLTGQTDADGEPVDLAEVLATVFETDRPSPWRALLEQRRPMQIGWQYDAFPWQEKKLRLGLELVRLLNFYRYPYMITTRSDLVAEEDYLEAIDSRLATVRMLTTGVNDRLTRLIEPGAPSLLRRFIALNKLVQNGVRTTALLYPLLPTYPDGHFTDPDYAPSSSEPKLEIFDITKLEDFVAELQRWQVPRISVIFAEPNLRACQRVSAASGVDLREFYPTKSGNGLRSFSSAEARHYIETISHACENAGIGVSS